MVDNSDVELEEFDELPLDEISDTNEDETEKQHANNGDESKKRIVKTARRVVNKRVTLDVLKLTGERGITEVINMAESVKFKGKGYESEDLAKTITLLHLWTRRLYPRMTFEDCLHKIEQLGKKRPAQTYLTKLRSGMIDEAKEATETSPQKEQKITDDIKERILRNRIMAQLRRETALKNKQQLSDEFSKLIQQSNKD